MGTKRDNRDDFNDYCDMWSKACEDGIFDDAPAPPPMELGDGLAAKMGIYDDMEEDEEYGDEGDAEDPYHSYMDSEEETVLHEQRKAAHKRKLLESRKKRKLLESKKKAANPIRPDTAGMDQKQPRPVWVEMDAFEKIDQLKRKLYDIECKLGEEDGGGKKWNEKVHESGGKKLLSQIESIRKQLDDLSDSLGLEDEPEHSMWNVDGRR